MPETLTRADCPYPGDHAFEFPSSLLHCKLHYHRERDELRDPALLTAIAPFLNAPNAAAAYRDVVRFARSLVRTSWEAGRLVRYCLHDRYNHNRVEEKIFLLDEWGNGWYFRSDDDRYDTHQFLTAFYAGGDAVPAAAGSRARAAVAARRRLVGCETVVADDGRWSDIRFGWADFWKPDWQPVARPAANPLARR